MSTTTKIEKNTKQEVLNNCWKYLRDNFHKFSESNKLKVALKMCAKDIPQESTQNLTVNQLPPVSIGNNVLDAKIGENA